MPDISDNFQFFVELLKLRLVHSCPVLTLSGVLSCSAVSVYRNSRVNCFFIIFQLFSIVAVVRNFWLF